MVSGRMPGILDWRMLVMIVFSPIVFAGSSSDNRLAILTDGQDFANWQEKSFKGNTLYKFVELEIQQVLQALSNASASGIYKRQSINIKEYPYLNWRWRIDNKLDVTDERKKSGDDYAARVYLVIDGGLFFWKSKALSYVWSNQSSAGDIWDNAYAGNSVKMFALKSSADPTSTWLHEKRNVFEDLKAVFGKEITTVDAVAVMTDTDDSKSSAVSYYADIFFSAN